MSGLMLGRSSLWKASTRFRRADTASTRTCHQRGAFQYSLCISTMQGSSLEMQTLTALQSGTAH